MSAAGAVKKAVQTSYWRLAGLTYLVRTAAVFCGCARRTFVVVELSEAADTRALCHPPPVSLLDPSSRAAGCAQRLDERAAQRAEGASSQRGGGQERLPLPRVW